MTTSTTTGPTPADPFGGDVLDRLCADRLRALADTAAFSPMQTRERCAVARRAGRNLAVACLSWDQITIFRALHDEGRKSRTWGRDVLALIAGPAVADIPPIICFESWLAFLEGIEEAARAVEARG